MGILSLEQGAKVAGGGMMRKTIPLSLVYHPDSILIV